MSNAALNPVITDAMLALIVAYMDNETAPGYIEFYAGTRPAPGAAPGVGNVLLGTCTLSDPSGTVSGGILSFADIADDLLADASGDLSWGRIYDGAGNFILDGDCGLTGSGALFIFNQIAVVAGGAVRVTTGSLQFGA